MHIHIHIIYMYAAQHNTGGEGAQRGPIKPPLRGVVWYAFKALEQQRKIFESISRSAGKTVPLSILVYIYYFARVTELF